MKNEKLVLGLALVILSLTLFHVLCLRGIYADGANSLLNILLSESFQDWDKPRKFAQIITQTPVVLALKLGIKNITLLTVLHSLGLFLFPSFFWLMGLVRLKGEVFFWPFFIVYTLVYMNSSFFAISEYNLAYSMVGYSFAVLISQKNIGKINGCFLIFVSLALARSYEALVFLGPLLYLSGILRVHVSRNHRRIEVVFVYIAMFFYATAAAISLWSILYPRSPGNLQGALAGVEHLLKNEQLLISALVSFLYFIIIFFNFRKTTKSILVGISLFLSSLLFLPTIWSAPDEHYAVRSSVGLMMFVFLCFLLLLRVLPSKKGGLNNTSIMDVNKVACLVPCVLFAALLTADVFHTYRYSRFVKEFRGFVNSNTGFYAIDDTEIDARTYGWFWTYPSFSLLLRDDDSKAIILNRKDYKGWQPFEPRKSLPNLSKYYVK